MDVNVENQPFSETRLSRLPQLVRSLPVFVVVFVPLAAIYIATASLTTHTHIDPLTNSLTGWHLGMTGSVVMPDHAEGSADDQYGNVGWVVDSLRGPVSHYPPGAAALSAPLYRLSGEPMTDFYVQGLNRPDADTIPFPLPSAGPAAITAALATAAAMGWLGATMPFAGGSRTVAIGAGYVAGLGTTMWSTASEAMWLHGPASMWLALGIYLVARSQLWWAGLAFGAAVITRPHTAFVAAAVGLAIALSRRSWMPILKVGFGSLLGLAGLLWYNYWLWGRLTVIGGYRGDYGGELVSTEVISFGENMVRALADPGHGLLVYSPFLIVLIPGLRAGWRRLPDWGRGAAIGAAAFWLVQFKVNRSSGGSGFLGYRYPLEALTSAAVLLTLSYVHWVRERPIVRRLFWTGVGIALILQINWKLVFVPVDGRTSR